MSSPTSFHSARLVCGRPGITVRLATSQGMSLALSGLLGVAVMVSAGADSLCNWETVSPASTNLDLLSVTWGTNQYVAVGDGGAVLTSPEGMTWTVRASETTRRLTGIAHGSGTFVAVGEGVILSSGDGESWTQRLAISNEILSDVIFAGQGFTAVGAEVTTNGGIQVVVEALVYTSSDGQNWERRSTGIAAALYSVVSGPGLLVAVGEGGMILYSSNGLDWTNTAQVANTDYLSGVAYGNGLYVAVGAGGGPCSGSGHPVTAISADGIQWERSVGGVDGACWFSDVTFGGGFFVGVDNYAARGGAYGMIDTSVDGQSWSKRLVINPHFRSAAYGNGRFLAVGIQGLVVRSAELAAAAKLPRIQTGGASWLSDGAMHLNVEADLGEILTLEFSTNLFEWWPLLKMTNQNCITELVDAETSDSQRRFYRLQQE